MASTPETPLPVPKVSQPWLWAVQVVVLISMALVFLSIPAGVRKPMSLFLLAFEILYLVTLWRLNSRTIKEGLALAIGTGSTMFLLALILPYSGYIRAEGICGWTESALKARLLAVAQVALVGLAIKAYRSMKRGPEDRRVLLHGSYVLVIGFFVALLSFLPLWDWGSRRGALALEQRAISTLRSMITALVTYQATCGAFPETLSVLAPLGPAKAPDCEHMDLLDEAAASGQKDSYVFNYQPLPLDAGERGTFTISARPDEQSENTASKWLRNFFIDESGIVRSTCEDRPATADDPPTD
jgi:hypothetical protein